MITMNNLESVLDLLLINLTIQVNPDKHETFSPLGCYMIKQAVQNEGLTVEIKDIQLIANLKNLNLEQLFKELFLSTKFVGFSCVQETLPLAIILAKRFNEHNIKTIIGGVGVNGVSKEIYKKFTFIDYIVEGRGISKILSILGKPNKNIEWIELDYKELYQNYNQVGIITSYGCLYQCSFCSVLHDFAEKPMEILENEISNILKFNENPAFNFWDDTLTCNHNKINRIFELFKSSAKDNFKWRCFGRLNQTTNKILDIFAQNNCDIIYYGFESGNQETLDKINKKIELSKALETIRYAKSLIKSIFVSFMWGFPWETLDEFNKTIHLLIWVKSIGCDVQIKRITPYPNTLLLNEFKNKLYFSETELMFSYSYFFSKFHQEIQNEMIDLIKQYHKDIFISYNFYETVETEKKYEILNQINW